MSERKFARVLCKPGSAAQVRDVVSKAVRNKTIYQVIIMPFYVPCLLISICKELDFKRHEDYQCLDYLIFCEIKRCKYPHYARYSASVLRACQVIIVVVTYLLSHMVGQIK